MRYNMVLSSEGNSTVVITDANLNTTTVDDSHPNFVRIIEALRNNEDPTEWFSTLGKDNLVALSDRVTVEGGKLCFDGDPVYDGLAQTIIRYRREGRDVHNLVRFMERLSNNPSFRSREQLFTWTQAKDLTIDSDGFIIGFKGVTRGMLSINSGSALVDGVPHNGQIPNAVGTVISMPRSKVQDDPTQGCSHGLHAGNWSYASGFGEVVLEVRIDPADVVSVPSDCSFQKLRCCRYEVVAIHETDDDDLSDYEPDADWDEFEAIDELEEWDDFIDYAPPTFVERLLTKLRNRNNG